MKRRIEEYNFNYQKEMQIYSYVCGHYMSKRKLKKLDSNLKFSTYADWKAYVENKYKNYPIAGLKEFSRYLNQKSRDMLPEQHWNELAIPVFLTLILEAVCRAIRDIEDSVNISLCGTLISILTILVMIVILGIFVVKVVREIILNKEIDYLYLDYKEIIDGIIKTKELQT